MANNVIRMTIGNAQGLAKLVSYRDRVKSIQDVMSFEVANEIARRAELLFSSAIVDDLVNKSARTANVTVSTTTSGALSLVIASGSDAIWAEFGAGVYHNGSPGMSPHPRGNELGFIIGNYGLGHGKKQTWGYYEDGELILTHGTPAAMPLYRATREVAEDLIGIVRDVIGRSI